MCSLKFIIELSKAAALVCKSLVLIAIDCLHFNSSYSVLLKKKRKHFCISLLQFIVRAIPYLMVIIIHTFPTSIKTFFIWKFSCLHHLLCDKKMNNFFLLYLALSMYKIDNVRNHKSNSTHLLKYQTSQE